jgi:hypothetical protein
VLIREHPPSIRPYKPDDHVKARRLAGPVRAQQSNDFALLDLQAYTSHYLAAAIRLTDLLGR